MGNAEEQHNVPAQGLTASQLALLAAPLDGSVVSTREQGGCSLSYVEGHYCIRKANEIFGPAGWTRRTDTMECITEREYKGKDRTGHFVAYRAHCVVSVRTEDGWVETDGHGYGEGIDYNNVGQAHESALKEAETDGMKRALMRLGDPFGLALYDKAQAHVAGATRPQAAQGGQREATGQQQGASPQQAAQEQVVGNVTCPDCGAPMRLRESKKGKFYGCSTYPECKGTRDLADAITEGAIAEAISSPKPAQSPPPEGAPQTPQALAEYLSGQGAKTPEAQNATATALARADNPECDAINVATCNAEWCVYIWEQHQASGAATEPA